MKRLTAAAILFFVGLAFGLILAHGPLNAQSDSEIMSKLDEISKSQEELKTAVNSIKDDLMIIKVRITQMQ